MGPWSFSDLLASDVMNWATRRARADHAQGLDIPSVLYLDRLAAAAGLTRKRLFRILAGEATPTTDVLVILCRETGSTRAVEELAESCGLLVVGKVPGDSPMPVALGSTRDCGARPRLWPE